MKKIFYRLKLKKTQDTTSASTRITSDNVEDHRKQVLAGGRKFKYPIQYLKYKLVFNAIIISVLSIAVAVVIVWWQLYPSQNTSDFFYRIVRVVPVPVASIDGHAVRYSDYMAIYRSSLHFLENIERIDVKSEDGKRQIDYIKQRAMLDAVTDAYASKLAAGLKITVSDSELNDFILRQRQTDDGETSEQSYNASIMDYYGWTPDEYRHVFRTKLLQQKVAYAVDSEALQIAEDIKSRVQPGTIDFASISASYGSNQVSSSTSGWVTKYNQDGGLAISASQLQKGQVSEIVKSIHGGGYYIIRLLDSKDDSVNYEYIHIKLLKFSDDLSKLIADDKLKHYIEIPEATNN
jgi:hypothetical protein